MFAPERYRPIKTLALFSVLAMGACGKNPGRAERAIALRSASAIVRQSCVGRRSIRAICVGSSQ